MQPMRMHRCTIAGCGKEFRLKAHLARHLATAHGLAIRAGSPRPVMKTRAAFCLITTPLTRISRQVCREILAIRKAVRQPFQPINIALIKQECQMRLPEMVNKILQFKKLTNPSTEPILQRLGIDTKAPKIALLEHTTEIKQPANPAFPKPDRKNMVPLGGFAPPSEMKPTPREESQSQLSPSQPSIMKKRGYEQTNGMDGPANKRAAVGVIRQAGNARGPMMRGSVINQLNGRGKVTGSRGRKTMMSWMEAPDDVYFVANDSTRKLRKQLAAIDFRRTARKPWRKLNVKLPFPAEAEPVVILD